MPPTFTELQSGFELGPWTVVPERGLLRQGDVKAHLEPMVMDVLMVLAGHQGSVVNRDQLVNAVWDGRFVADEAIVAKIATLRHKLGDDAKNPIYIETVPRRGYRLMMPVVIPDSVQPERIRNSRLPYYLFSIVLVAASLLTWKIFGPPPRPDSPPDDGRIESVAVLQFKNLSDNKERFQYIVEGFREELAISLGQVPNLEVTRGPQLSDENTAVAIIREFNVDAVISGSLRADGNKIRITAVLISANGFQIWTGRFDGAAGDVFSLQENVATQVRNVILGETGEQIRAASRPANAEAFDEYMRGQLFLNKRNVESLKRAQSLFEKTIEFDPNFGPAYLRLAVTHLLLSDYSTDQRREIFEKAIEIADRGAKADPSIREAAGMIHGFVYHQYGNWADAMAAYDLAFHGKTIFPTAHQWYSRLLSAVGRLDDSLTHAITARSMEPASQVLNSRVANAYLWLNDMDNARHFFEEANEMGVGAPIHHFGYTMFLIRDGRLEDARATAKRAYQLLQGDDWWVDPVFDGLAHPDDPELRSIAYETARKMVTEGVPPYITLIVWSLFGQTDRAMDVAMQLATSGKLYEHESAQVEVIYLDELKPLREHKDFPILLRRLGLADYWVSVGCRWSDDQVRCNAP
jgi:DNA-binding winged helix-turn-helix (wHTH) protein/TolB-like protein